MQSKAMEMLDNLDKNPATGMGKKVSTVHNLVYGTMCTLLSTKSIARGWEPVRDATVTKPNPLTSRLWGSHAAAKNPHPTGTYLIRLPFMGPPMVTHAGRGHNICQESRNTSKLPLTLSRVWHIGVANPRRRVP